MSYKAPEDVVSPKDRLNNVRVILDKGEGDTSYALGEWDGGKAMLYRWNGTEETPKGNPISNFQPTWIVLERSLRDAAISTFEDEAVRKEAKEYFNV